MENTRYLALGLTATAIALFAGANTATAQTLFFNKTLNQHGQTLHWESPFEGQIKLNNTLTTTGTGAIETNIWMDGKLLDALSLATQGTNSTANIGSEWFLDVKKGTILDFSLDAPNAGSNAIAFEAKISLPSSNLVFLQPEGSNSFLHVGLLQDGKIYESSPAYSNGNYWDIFQENGVAISADNGVQNQHTFGSFVHLSELADNTSIEQRDIVEISAEDAAKMEQFINTQMGKGYTMKPSYMPFLTPYAQKGYYGTYTGVGLIERAAEEAGITLLGGEFFHTDEDPQGFILNDLEFLYVTDIMVAQNAPWECLTVFPTSVQCQTQYGNRNPSSGIPFSTLSPAYMHYLLTNQNSAPSDNWLHGLFEGLDFILTDPEGRRLGYTEELGLLNEIPDAFYTGNLLDEPEHFYVPDRLQGEYSLQLYGLCNKGAMAAIGDNKNGSLISGCKPDPPKNRKPESVPEPSALLGLMLLGGFLAKLKKSC
ncbi:MULTISPECIES: PEP-CTERM sorting domain-containing protein [Spirulina sp. CCY15215]|uniref:PEP-CTERM sorting domain-containing protein n=1 Tax=Spirulina sp. CCY15215 TaxID=2767591 RepID=UPI00194FADD2|nr:PEP-CTERM sorting domain-containing protein [Spirulina major]